MSRSATPPLGIVSFLLTLQERRRRIPATFSVGFWSAGTGAVSRNRFHASVCRERFAANGKMARHSRGGKTCSICRDGLCNASIRSARLAATGCALPIPEENSAAIAALRSAMFRHRWAHACGCVPARWVVTVHRAARRAGNGNRSKLVSGPLVRCGGRAVPANMEKFEWHGHSSDCGKNVLFCHSERSEESLFDLSIRKETRRDSSLRSE